MKKISLCLVMAFMASLAMAQTRVKVQFVDGTNAKGAEGSAMVADGHLYTKWCYSKAGDMPYYVILSTVDNPIVLKQYALATGDDTNWYPDRNPISWNVYGSNDQKSWTLIDEQKRNLKMQDENEQVYTFPVKSASTAYKYYKLEFKKLRAGSMIQLSEIYLYK